MTGFGVKGLDVFYTTLHSPPRFESVSEKEKKQKYKLRNLRQNTTMESMCAVYNGRRMC